MQRRPDFLLKNGRRNLLNISIIRARKKARILLKLISIIRNLANVSRKYNILVIFQFTFYLAPFLEFV